MSRAHYYYHFKYGLTHHDYKLLISSWSDYVRLLSYMCVEDKKIKPLSFLKLTYLAEFFGQRFNHVSSLELSNLSFILNKMHYCLDKMVVPARPQCLAFY